MKAVQAGRVLGTALDDLTDANDADCPAGMPEDMRCGMITIFVNLVDYNGESVELAVNDTESAGLLGTETIFDPLGGLVQGNLTDEQRAARAAQITQADKILRYLAGRQTSGQSAKSGSEVLADRISAVDVNGANIYAKNILTLDFSASGGLVVDGTARFNGNAFFNKAASFAGHIQTGGEAPTPHIEVAAGATVAPADNPTAALANVTIDGNDTAGELRVKSGHDAGAGKLVSITFNEAYTKPPRVFLAPTNSESAQLRYFVTSTADGFSITMSDPPPPGASLHFNYWVVE